MSDILADLNALKADHSAALNLLEEAKASQDSIKGELAEALAAKEAALADSASASANLSSLKAQLEGLQAELASLKANEKTAAERAVEIVAAQGIAPVAVAATDNNKPTTREQALALYAAAETKEAKAAVYGEYKALLLGR